MAPDMEQVDSSSIEAIGFDERSRELWVQFRDGGTYVYLDVPAEVHAEFTRADSKGSYFIREIRDTYAFRRVYES